MKLQLFVLICTKILIIHDVKIYMYMISEKFVINWWKYTYTIVTVRKRYFMVFHTKKNSIIIPPCTDNIKLTLILHSKYTPL